MYTTVLFPNRFPFHVTFWIVAQIRYKFSIQIGIQFPWGYVFYMNKINISEEKQIGTQTIV